MTVTGSGPLRARDIDNRGPWLSVVWGAGSCDDHEVRRIARISF